MSLSCESREQTNEEGDVATRLPSFFLLFFFLRLFSSANRRSRPRALAALRAWPTSAHRRDSCMTSFSGAASQTRGSGNGGNSVVRASRRLRRQRDDVVTRTPHACARKKKKSTGIRDACMRACASDDTWGNPLGEERERRKRKVLCASVLHAASAL